MEIKVLGTGCASCKALYTAVIQAVSETGIEAKVVKVEELTEIMTVSYTHLDVYKRQAFH